jgi:hypothetical protein
MLVRRTAQASVREVARYLLKDRRLLALVPRGTSLRATAGAPVAGGSTGAAVAAATSGAGGLPGAAEVLADGGASDSMALPSVRVGGPQQAVQAGGPDQALCPPHPLIAHLWAAASDGESSLCGAHLSSHMHARSTLLLSDVELVSCSCLVCMLRRLHVGQHGCVSCAPAALPDQASGSPADGHPGAGCGGAGRAAVARGPLAHMVCSCFNLTAAALRPAALVIAMADNGVTRVSVIGRAG